MRKLLIFFMFLIGFTSLAFAVCNVSCPNEKIDFVSQVNGDNVYFDSQFNVSDCVVTPPTPTQAFNVNLFLEQLATTSLLTQPNIFQYYAVLKDLFTFGNFQGAANLIGGLLQGGAITQDEVDVIDKTLENQQINLASYNSQVNIAY